MIQAVERLRSYQSDAQRLLQSRKRKLAELYDSTLCRGSRSPGQINDLYFQQLQAFQDANDLQKGRLFAESSLPPRREIIRALPTSSPATTTTQIADTTQYNVRRSNSPAKLGLSSTKRGSVPPLSRPPSPRSTAQSRPTSTHPPDEASPIYTASARAASILGDTASSLPATLPDGAIGQASDAACIVPNDSSQRQPSTEQQENSPAIPPPIEAQDAQSSPTSSNGRPPSRTPGPEAASPTTSPGNDSAPTLDVMNLKPPEPRSDGPQTPELAAVLSHKMSISSIDVDMIDADPTTAFESPIQQSKHLPSPIQEARPTKPSITIDTKQDQKFHPEPRQSSAIVETPAGIDHSPPQQTPVPTQAVSDPARRATRIQSGVLQKKSVSEILGETPRSASPNNDTTLSVIGRATEKDRKDKERSRLSTVVFAKPQRPVIDANTIEVARNDQLSKNQAKDDDRDYMYTLFESKAQSQNRQGSLPYLLQHSHKTISTSDHLVDYHYQAHCRVLKRLYQLQNLDRWSLRQRKRAEEPVRPTSHWDFLLNHTKWMRTDFREERRWKMAAARTMAEDCAEWVSATPSDRKAMQIKVRPPKHRMDMEMLNGYPEQQASSPPGLEPHGDDDSVSEDIADPREIVSSIAPAAIFSLGPSEFTFATEKTPAFDKLLNELPLYQPAKLEPDMSKSNLAEKLDARWKTNIVPVSRYATEKLKFKEYQPPLKRSRYDYEVDDSPPPKRSALEPRETGVALFMPENKHIRDRIHPGHAFRPPAEHPMPSQAFFETRMSSQWLASEDDEVRRQAREFSFNWTLISDLMTPPTLYQTGQDRRSAWECFERWIGLEGMPADMAKTPYFKTYSNRIETAQRNVQAQWEQIEQRNGGTAAVSNRRKTTLPVRVERKSNRRHLFMLDAMRKLAKRREATRQKAMHNADLAAMRKTNDVHAPRPMTKTPAEWSQLKFEREQKMQKQQEIYKQQLIAHQRAVVQQQRAGPNGTSNGAPMPPNGAGQIRLPGPNGAPMPGMPNGHLQVPNGQPRPPNMMGMSQGMNLPTGMVGPKGMPQQMPVMRGGMAGSPQQVKMQQELIRQAQANGNHSSPNIPQATMINGQGMTNAAFVNNLNQINTQGSPSGNHASPRPPSSHMPQSLSSGSMPRISQLVATIRERNPNMSDEEVKNTATQQLLQWQQQATAAAAGNVPRPKAVNQAALNAAMGAANSGAYAAAQNQNAMNMSSSVGATGQGMMSYEQAQQYHQRMRMQAQAQQNAARGMPAPIAPGMTASPIMNMVRPASQHSQGGMNNVAMRRGSATPVPTGGPSVSTTANMGAAQNQNQTNRIGNAVSQVATPGPGTGPQSSPRPTAPTPTPMQT